MLLLLLLKELLLFPPCTFVISPIIQFPLLLPLRGGCGRFRRLLIHQQRWDDVLITVDCRRRARLLLLLLMLSLVTDRFPVFIIMRPLFFGVGLVGGFDIDQDIEFE